MLGASTELHPQVLVTHISEADEKFPTNCKDTLFWEVRSPVSLWGLLISPPGPLSPILGISELGISERDSGKLTGQLHA